MKYNHHIKLTEYHHQQNTTNPPIFRLHKHSKNSSIFNHKDDKILIDTNLFPNNNTFERKPNNDRNIKLSTTNAYNKKPNQLQEGSKDGKGRKQKNVAKLDYKYQYITILIVTM